MHRYVSLAVLLVLGGCSSDDGSNPGGTSGENSSDNTSTSTSASTMSSSSGPTNTTTSGTTSTVQSTATATTTTGTTTAGTGTTGGFGQNTSSTATGATMGSNGAGGMSSAVTAESTTSGTTTGSSDCVPQVDCEPEALPSSGDIYQDCVDRVNQFRVGCWCLPALTRWTEAEDCANQHAQYDYEQDTAHAGFSDNICSNGGWAQNECPGWRSEEQIVEGCLQSMYNEGPPPSGQCSGQCYQQHGHFINMTNEDYTMVACGFYTTPGGEVWSVQNFR